VLKVAAAGAFVLSGIACLACGAGALATLSVGAAQAGSPTVPVAASGGMAMAAGGTPAGGGTSPAVATIPPEMLALYQKAAATQCPGMPWQILAAIGDVESGNGTSDLPGVRSGTNYAGAEGPMQFLPATFAAYDTPVPPGGASPPSPYDPADAVYAAARLLCSDGAARGDYRAAIFAYNHTSAYVAAVWSVAVSYGMATASPARSPAGSPAGNPAGSTVTGAAQ
jgi:hypothetical protein